MNSTKIMHVIAKGDKDWSGIPFVEQTKIISSFAEPQNDFERSYFQYSCQRHFRSKSKFFVFDFFSFFTIPFIIIGLLVSRIFRKKDSVGRSAIGSMAECKNVIPDSLRKEFDIDLSSWMNGFSLSIKDISCLWKVIINTPFSPYYFLKITLKMAAYSEMIYRYKPKAFIVHDEYSFTSSLMTWYSNSRGVEQIDVMHGEKLYYIGDSFFRYNRCYVWDDHYKKLFIKLRADSKQFIVERPEALKLNIGGLAIANRHYKYKYYLQIYNENEIKSIVNSLSFAKIENANVSFRPHPYFSDMALLNKYVPSSCIENPRNVTLDQSIANTDVVIGYFSTVLYQAYLNGKKVVLDDVTFKEGYMKLKEHEYIMTKCKNVGLLSEYQ